MHIRDREYMHESVVCTSRIFHLEYFFLLFYMYIRDTHLYSLFWKYGCVT